MFIENRKSMCISRTGNPCIYRRQEIHVYIEDRKSMCTSRTGNPCVYRGQEIHMFIEDRKSMCISRTGNPCVYRGQEIHGYISQIVFKSAGNWSVRLQTKLIPTSLISQKFKDYLKLEILLTVPFTKFY